MVWRGSATRRLRRRSEICCRDLAQEEQLPLEQLHEGEVVAARIVDMHLQLAARRPDSWKSRSRWKPASPSEQHRCPKAGVDDAPILTVPCILTLLMLVCNAMLSSDSTVNPGGFARDLERYLETTLHQHISVTSMPDPPDLPVFLTKMYTFFKAAVAGRCCIFMTPIYEPASPAEVAKHVRRVRSDGKRIAVFASGALTSHYRSRLIEHAVPFVVPGNQLYIPDLATDLREHFVAGRSKTGSSLSPAAQAVLFHYLLRINPGATTPTDLAKILNYSAMSIGRAFDDLVSRGLAETEWQGRERHIHFRVSGRQLLESARNLLRSPVRSYKHVRGQADCPGLKRSGETALADLTDLSPPALTTYAVDSRRWKATVSSCSLALTNRHDADFVVETWTYDPAGLSTGSTVDPLSLYAQYHQHHDERVLMAVEDLVRRTL